MSPHSQKRDTIHPFFVSRRAALAFFLVKVLTFKVLSHHRNLISPQMMAEQHDRRQLPSNYPARATTESTWDIEKSSFASDVCASTDVMFALMFSSRDSVS